MPGYQYRGNQRDTETPVPASTPRPHIPTPTTRKDPAVATTKPASRTLPVWEEPPARSGGQVGYVSVVIDHLKAHPGKWARVKDGLKNAGGASTWTKRGCQAVTRRVGDTYSVWARWPEATS